MKTAEGDIRKNYHQRSTLKRYLPGSLTMIYVFADCVLDEALQELRRAGQVVAVEPKVFEVLVYLLQHRDRIVTKEELFEQCWPDTFVSEAALNRCLTKVRQAVQTGRGGPPVIQTVRSRGYRIVVAVEMHPADTTDVDVSIALPLPSQEVLPPASSTGRPEALARRNP
jgi:DNA-binding winged helix-turn-helix (wHTH) protein